MMMCHKYCCCCRPRGRLTTSRIESNSDRVKKAKGDDWSSVATRRIVHNNNARGKRDAAALGLAMGFFFLIVRAAVPARRPRSQTKSSFCAFFDGEEANFTTEKSSFESETWMVENQQEGAQCDTKEWEDHQRYHRYRSTRNGRSSRVGWAWERLP
jgi:hypothetical protein